MTMRAASLWSVIWVAFALGFGAAFWAVQGSEPGSEFLAGYVLERSLSLDNVFVFAVIIGYFAVPAEQVRRVLAWGIGLALALRVVFIVLGAALLEVFHLTYYLFGVLLLYTAYRLSRHDTGEV